MTANLNPFDILPNNLFNLFSTMGVLSLQRHYMAILLRIYDRAEFNRFGLTREVVIAEIIDYLKSEGAEKEVAAEMAYQAENDQEEQSPVRAGDEQAYAAYLLRRLDETGWVEREQHADYTETILLPDYAFTLLEAFRSIQEQKPRQFTGQLYTAHQLLISASTNKDFSPALAVTQAYENVRQVVRGLSELNQNIRRYIERATRGKEIAEVLRLQFDDYAHTLGPAYHALKTSDHLSRYRRDMVQQLQSWQLDADWLDKTAAELATQIRLSPAQALQEIEHYLDFIIHQLENLDPLVASIDRRHAQYLQTSLRQIRYQLASADGSFKERLISLAQGLSTLKEAGMVELPPGAPQPVRQPVDLPDLHSYYTPPTRRAIFQPAAVQAPVLLPGDLVSMRLTTLQDVTRALTPQKVNRMVNGFFNGHARLALHEIPPQVVADLNWMTTIIAYAYHPEVDYGLEMVAGEPFEVGVYRIAPFELVKRGV